jgi:hypothetical protein
MVAEARPEAAKCIEIDVIAVSVEQRGCALPVSDRQRRQIDQRVSDTDTGPMTPATSPPSTITVRSLQVTVNEHRLDAALVEQRMRDS